MAFTEFYCDFTNGSNLNAGSTNTAAIYTSAGGDSDGTSVFTPNDGSTPASTVSVGMFGSVYVTAGATVAVFVGRITTVAAGVNGAITFSTTAKSGTFPAASAGAHTITLQVGGYWKGPNAAVGFPFGFIAGATTNVAGDNPRVNLINANGSTKFSITAAMTHGVLGPMRFQGMTASPGDGGKAIIDGGTSGVSYTLLTLSSGNTTSIDFEDIIWQNNGASASATGVTSSLQAARWRRCVFNSFRGTGFSATNLTNMQECEIYGCNQSNTGGLAGVAVSSSSAMKRCYIHDNTGNATVGVHITTAFLAMESCVIESNGKYGIDIFATNGGGNFNNCDIYNNGSDGINLGAASAAAYWIYAENCNFVKNSGYGINFAGTGNVQGAITNCGFGSGTQVNTSGQTNGLGGVEVSGSVTYPSGVTPWNAPTTGDFRIILPQAQYVGRGTFTETDGTNTGTVAYPDIGAAQHSLASAGAAILFA